MTEATERETRRKQQRKGLDQLRGKLLPTELQEKALAAALDYVGPLDVLESAIGCLVIGHMYGWRVVRIVHDPRTVAKYEQLLGVKFRDLFPDEGPLAERSIGYQWAKKLGKFWQVVAGAVPVEGKKSVGFDSLDLDGVA